MPTSRSSGRTQVPLPATGLPAMRITPWSACSSPATIRSSVVFPHPLGPSRVTISPQATLRLQSSITVTSPKDLDRFSTDSRGTGGVGAMEM